LIKEKQLFSLIIGAIIEIKELLKDAQICRIERESKQNKDF